MNDKDIMNILSLDAGASCIKIEIQDGGKQCIKISDNGIGMTKDELIESLGTIAKSGTEDFIKKMENEYYPENKMNLGHSFIYNIKYIINLFFF